MGFGGLAATAIMFIAVVVVTGAITAMMTRQVNDVAASATSSQELAAKKMQTDVVIDHVYYNSSSGQVRVYVKNIGLTSLDINLMTVYVNNNFFKVNGSSAPSTILPDTNNISAQTFDQDEVVEINVSHTISGSGTHTAKVLTQYNTETTKIFTT